MSGRGPKLKRMVEIGGKEVPLRDWAKSVGMDYQTAYNRLVLMNWTAEKALKVPVAKGL